MLVIVLGFFKHTFLAQFLMKNSISLFKLHFCPYLCDMLFLVKTLKKGFKVELQKFSSPKLISQDRLTQELYLFA